MNKFLILALLALVFTGITLFQQKPALEQRMNENRLTVQFQNWMREYNMNFTGSQYQYRFSVFVQNVKEIEEINNSNFTYTAGINQFTATTRDEFIETYLGAFPEANASKVIDTNYTVNGAVDWRQKGAVSPVKDQGQCGSCWAFSTTGTVESAYAISKGKVGDFSEQQLVDCSSENYGCNGGWPYKAMNWIKANGIQNESAYPYTARDGNCKLKNGPNKISSVKQSSGCSALTADINSAPTSVCVDASNWSAYKSGVFNNCRTSINHAVLAVGYDASGNWIVKNSWGTRWGEQGYIRLAAGNTCNVCAQLANVSV